MRRRPPRSMPISLRATGAGFCSEAVASVAGGVAARRVGGNGTGSFDGTGPVTVSVTDAVAAGSAPEGGITSWRGDGIAAIVSGGLITGGGFGTAGVPLAAV